MKHGGHCVYRFPKKKYNANKQKKKIHANELRSE